MGLDAQFNLIYSFSLPTCHIQQHLPRRYMYSNAVPAGLLFLAILVYFPSAPPLPPRWRMDLTFHNIWCVTHPYIPASRLLWRDLTSWLASRRWHLLFCWYHYFNIKTLMKKANYKFNNVHSLIGCEDQRILAHCHWLLSSTGCCNRLDRHDGSLLLCHLVDSVLCFSVISSFD